MIGIDENIDSSLSSEQIIEKTKEVRKLLPLTPLSVTIPHTLSLIDQISLARELERLGVDVLQTEGVRAFCEDYFLSLCEKSVQEKVEEAVPEIVVTYELSRAVSIPVMCASGSLTEVTVPLILAAGCFFILIFNYF
jgi:hypothetical protein